MKRPDTPVLLYDLGNLDVITKGKDGTLYGYDREGRRQKITFDTRSIYALKMENLYLEIIWRRFLKTVYDRKSEGVYLDGSGDYAVSS